MKVFFERIRSYYHTHPLFQVISFFLMISFVIYVAYTISTMSFKSDKYLKIDESKQVKTTPTVVKKVEKKNSATKKASTDTPVTTVQAKEKKTKEKNTEEAVVENNIKTIQKLRSKRFDSDIKNSFNFDNDF